MWKTIGAQGIIYIFSIYQHKTEQSNFSRMKKDNFQRT